MIESADRSRDQSSLIETMLDIMMWVDPRRMYYIYTTYNPAPITIFFRNPGS